MNSILSELATAFLALSTVLIIQLLLQRDKQENALLKKTVVLQGVFALICLSTALKYKDLISLDSIKFLLAPALLYCLTNAKDKSFKPLSPWLLVPFVLFIFLEVFSYSSEFRHQAPVFNLNHYDLLWTSLLLLQFWATWALLKHRVSQVTPYSSLNIHLMVYTLVIVLSLIFMAGSWFSNDTSGLLFDLSVLIFTGALTFNSVKVTVAAKMLVPGEPQLPIKYERSAVAQGEHNQQIRLLKKYMDQTAAYKQHDLRLTDLARGLNVSSHHISQVLNSAMDQSFYEFVNTYRVREAQAMLKSEAYDHLSIEGIAMEAGFKNKNSFNSHFKRLNQMTANQFRKKHRIESSI